MPAPEPLPDGVLTFDREWRCTYLTPAAARLIGKRNEDLVGLTASRFLPEAVRTPFCEAARRVETSDEPVHFEIQYPPLAVWFEVSVFSSGDGYTVMLRDATARKRAEEAQRAGEARQSLLLDLMQGQRATSDPDAMMASAAEALIRHLRANRVGFFEMADDDTLTFTVCRTDGGLAPLSGTFPAAGIGTGYLAEVRAGRTLGIADMRRDPRTADSAFEEIGVRSGIGAPIIRGGRWHAGLYVNHASVREWTADEIALVRDVADLTWDAVERARAALALRESEARFRAVWEATSDAIALSAPDGTVLAANPAYLDLYGFEEKEVVGQSFAVIFPEEQRAWAEEQHRAVFTSAELPGAFEARVRRRDGVERVVESRADFVVEEGRRTALVSAIRDVTDRRAAEEKLRASEERFRTLFDSIDQGFCTIEVLFDDGDRPIDFVFQEVNPAFMRNTGLNDVVGKRMRELAPDHEEFWFETYGRVARTGEPRRFEAQAAALDRWYNVNAFRVGDPDEHRIAILFEDITERRNAAAALEASQHRLRTLVQNVHDYAIIGLDPNGIISEWTEGAERVKGYKSEEVVGKPVTMFSTPEDVAAGVPQRELAKAAATGRSENESWRVRKGGERFWANEIATAIRDDEGTLIGFTKISRDLTMQRQAEQALRESEERFRTLIQRSADAVQLISPDGTILYSSDSVETVLGYRPDEIAGRNATTYIHPDDLTAVLDWITQVSAQPNGVGSHQYRVRHKDGSWAWVETTIANHLATPTINAIVGNFRNITERKQVEAEREAFAAAAAHDLKTPLTSLRGQVQLLLRRARRGALTDVEALTSRLGMIDAAAGRMVVLIDEMLDAAHLRAGRTLDLKLAPVDLVALAEAVVEEVRLSTTRHEVRVVAEVETLVGTGDHARLVRALSNLLSNAVKFSPKGGKIDVRVERKEDAAGMWAVLSVTDQGIGIPAVDLPHLFERFHRGGNVTGLIAGTGIGLAGAKQIVEQHGGTIWVESEEGKGATFTMSLPMLG